MAYALAFYIEAMQKSGEIEKILKRMWLE